MFLPYCIQLGLSRHPPVLAEDLLGAEECEGKGHDNIQLLEFKRWVFPETTAI